MVDSIAPVRCKVTLKFEQRKIFPNMEWMSLLNLPVETPSINYATLAYRYHGSGHASALLVFGSSLFACSLPYLTSGLCRRFVNGSSGYLRHKNILLSVMKHEIPHGLSIYLDLIRLAAASIVVMSHLWSLAIPTHPLPWPGHSAVVVFFVLSGFVISHAAHPELTLRSYLHHRTARIYPVVLCAGLLSIVLCTSGIKGLQYAGPSTSNTLDILLNVSFLAQTWLNVSLPYNDPFWSLNYEVWYYILFGAWCYFPSRWLVCAIALMAGPKILLLMPVWLLGVYLQRTMRAVSPRAAMWIFMISAAAGLTFFWLDLSIRIREIMKEMWPFAMEQLRGSNQFVGDFILGLIVATNFFAAGSIGMRPLVKCEKVIRYLSSFTFSVYLFHMPLAVLIWNVLGIHSPLVFFALLGIGIVAIAQLTERRTKWYRSLLAPLFNEGQKKAPSRRDIAPKDVNNIGRPVEQTLEPRQF